MHSLATDGNAAAERNHGHQVAAIESNRALLREEFEGTLARALRTSPSVKAELDDLIRDDYKALQSLLTVAESDPAEAGLALNRMLYAYCERVERDMLDCASRNVIEMEIAAAQRRNGDNDYQSSVTEIERFIKEIAA